MYSLYENTALLITPVCRIWLKEKLCIRNYRKKLLY